MPTSREPRWRRLALMTALVVVGAAAPSLPPGVRNWDNRVKLQVAWNMIDGKGPVLTRPTPYDEMYVMPGADGRKFTSYPYLAAVLQTPTLLLGALTGVFVEGVPFLLLLGVTAGVVVLWSRRAGATPTAAAAAAMLVALGNGLWAYAAHGYDVQIEVVALALLLWAASGGGRVVDLAVAGLGIGAAFATRTGAAVLVLPTAVAIVLSGPRRLVDLSRRALAFGAGAAPGLALVLWFNWYRFGSPFVAHTRSGLGSTEQLFVPWFSTAHLEAIAGLLVSPGKGVFWYAPPTIAVVALAPMLWRRARVEVSALAVYAVSAVLLLARLTFWHGEWGWGPRYLAPLALASAPLAWWISERLAVGTAAARRMALLALGVLVLLQALPVAGYPVESHLNYTLPRLVEAGELVTRPLQRPPLPVDNRVLYFRPRNSMIASLLVGMSDYATDPRVARRFLTRLALALIVPVSAILWVARAKRLAAPRAPVSTPAASGAP